MEDQKFQINLAPGTEKADIIIREVNNVNELPVKAPINGIINGTIGAVYEFLTKRKDLHDQKQCIILVDREKISIHLIVNEHDAYTIRDITGKLEMHPKFVAFGINTGKAWGPTELGLFVKMHRAFFTSKEDNMKLVTELMNFDGKVNSIVQKGANEKGDRTDNFSQVVDSNLPKAFTLKIPIFKGMPAETLEVETFAQVDGRDVSFMLLSPAANQVQEDIRDSVIDTEIAKIRDLCPDIAIIEV